LKIDISLSIFILTAVPGPLGIASMLLDIIFLFQLAPLNNLRFLAFNSSKCVHLSLINEAHECKEYYKLNERCEEKGPERFFTLGLQCNSKGISQHCNRRKPFENFSFEIWKAIN
jgi:hypothetical protein